MPLNTVTIKSIISTPFFQKECLSILTLTSEICEIPVIILSFIDSNATSSVIAQTENSSKFDKKNLDILNTTVVIEKATQVSSDTIFSMGVPIIFEGETINGTLSLWDSKPRILDTIQLQIIDNLKRQIQNLYQLERQKIELREKKIYRKTLDLLPTEIALFDDNHNYLYVNPAAIQNEDLRNCIMGKDDFEYATHTLRDPQFAEERRERFSRAVKLNTTIEWVDEIKNVDTGETSFYTRKYTPVFNEDGTFEMMIGFGTDITKRKNLEEQNRLLIDENNRNKIIQLNEAKNMYRLLADNTVDLVCLHNLDTSFEYISPSIMKLMGYTPEELIGQFPMNYVHPKDLEIIQHSFTSFINESDDENAYVEARFRNKKGDYVWFEIKASIVKENGEPISFQTSARNITQQKEVQYAMKKALVQERELNELRTNLVSTISHEFRTPMTTIRASAELIEMYIEGHNFVHSAQLQKRINTITEEIDRIVELMNAVLTISKDDAGKTNFNPIHFDLKRICLDVIETSYSHQFGGRKVQTLFTGENFTVFADKNLMEYSLFNLLNNAFKYSGGTDDINLNITSKNEKIEVQIIDKGIGIPEKDIPKLFNTFFRASNTEGIQGTGLGLYIVKTFTERNSGSIRVESKLGKGTTVTLQFPISKQTLTFIQ